MEVRVGGWDWLGGNLMEKLRHPLAEYWILCLIKSVSEKFSFGNWWGSLPQSTKGYKLWIWRCLLKVLSVKEEKRAKEKHLYFRGGRSSHRYSVPASRLWITVKQAEETSRRQSQRTLEMWSNKHQREGGQRFSVCRGGKWFACWRGPLLSPWIHPQPRRHTLETRAGN